MTNLNCLLFLTLIALMPLQYAAGQDLQLAASVFDRIDSRLVLKDFTGAVAVLDSLKQSLSASSDRRMSQEFVIRYNETVTRIQHIPMLSDSLLVRYTDNGRRYAEQYTPTFAGASSATRFAEYERLLARGDRQAAYEELQLAELFRGRFLRTKRERLVTDYDRARELVRTRDFEAADAIVQAFHRERESIPFTGLGDSLAFLYRYVANDIAAGRQIVAYETARIPLSKSIFCSVRVAIQPAFTIDGSSLAEARRSHPIDLSEWDEMFSFVALHFGMEGGIYLGSQHVVGLGAELHSTHQEGAIMVRYDTPGPPSFQSLAYAADFSRFSFFAFYRITTEVLTGFRPYLSLGFGYATAKMEPETPPAIEPSTRQRLYIIPVTEKAVMAVPELGTEFVSSKDFPLYFVAATSVRLHGGASHTLLKKAEVWMSVRVGIAF
jgi:hypothetical protein